MKPQKPDSTSRLALKIYPAALCCTLALLLAAAATSAHAATAPIITNCPSDLVVSNTPGQCYASNVVFTVPGATGSPAPVVICRLTNTIITSPHSFTVATNVITCTATNVVGTNTCSFKVIVRDTEAPRLFCQSDRTVECGTPFSFATPTARDNCDANVHVMLAAAVTNAGACGLTFVVTWTWRATDSSGNSGGCSQKITVVDTTPPVLSGVPPNTNYMLLADVPPPATVTVTDNCATSPVVVFSQSTNCNSSMRITRIWQAFDGCSNSTAGQQVITVERAAPQFAICPSDLVVSNTLGHCYASNVVFAAPRARRAPP